MINYYLVTLCRLESAQKLNVYSSALTFCKFFSRITWWLITYFSFWTLHAVYYLDFFSPDDLFYLVVHQVSHMLLFVKWQNCHRYQTQKMSGNNSNNCFPICIGGLGVGSENSVHNCINNCFGKKKTFSSYAINSTKLLGQ